MAVHATKQIGKVLLVTLITLFLAAGSPGAVGLAHDWNESEQSQPINDQHDSMARATPGGAIELGLVGSMSYQSPQFGFEITWTDAWQADLSSMESNPEIALDRLSIVSGTARFQAFYVAAEGETAGEYAERFLEFRLSGDPSMEIVGTGDRRGVYWIAYTSESAGTDVKGVVEITLAGDGTAIQVVEIMDHAAEFERVFSDSQESIEVEGEGPFRVLLGWPE
jgi:hypothetical protein